MIAVLRKERFENPKGTAESLGDLVTNNWTTKLQLTLFGVAAAQGGDRWTQPFIPMVKRAVELFLRAPRSNPKITNIDFREVARDWNPERLRRASGLYQDALLAFGGGASSSPDGAWQVGLTARCLGFRDVDTIWAFRERAGAPFPHAHDTLGPEQRQLASWILERWRANRPPDSTDVVMAHLHLKDPDAAFQGIPTGLFEIGSAREITPRIAALLELRPNTDDDLNALVRVISAACELYLEKEALITPTIEDIASRSTLSVNDIVRLLGVVNSIPAVGIRVQTGVADPHLTIGESIFEMEHVRTVPDLLSWIASKDAERTSWAGAVSGAPLEHHLSHGEEFDEVIRARDDAGARLREAFQQLDLHPAISQAAANLFTNGHYRNAVLDAAVALVNLVKQKALRPDLDGVALMRTVFSKNDPALAFNPLADQSDRDEQEGMMHLLEGAVLALRNPRAHTLVPDAPEAALEYIALLSLLAKRVAASTRR